MKTLTSAKRHQQPSSNSRSQSRMLRLLAAMADTRFCCPGPMKYIPSEPSVGPPSNSHVIFHRSQYTCLSHEGYAEVRASTSMYPCTTTGHVVPLQGLLGRSLNYSVVLRNRILPRILQLDNSSYPEGKATSLL